MPAKKCEICGEMISNLKFKQHMMTHADSSTVKQAMDKPADKPVKADKIPAKVNDETAELIARARRVQQEMLEAPEAFLSEDSSDQHMALRKVHCPESLGSNRSMECIFGHSEMRLDGYVAKGYEPIIDDKGEIVRDDGGHPMLRIPKKIYDSRKAVYQKESQGRLRAVTQMATKRSTASGMPVAGGDLHEEELTITKTSGG